MLPAILVSQHALFRLATQDQAESIAYLLVRILGCRPASRGRLFALQATG